MKSKNILILILLISPFLVFAQSEINQMVQEGIVLHDAGKYEAAIAKYKEALNIDKKSSLVNYELGFSYFAKKEYKKAIKCLDQVIKNGDALLKEAFATKGSCLDDLGKPKEAIKIYQHAIEKFPEDYLLYYNLALTQYNQQEEKDAEANLIQGVSLNPIHSSSHFLLGIIKANAGRKVESFLALHFFLLIEPNTKRSEEALSLLKQVMGDGVKKIDGNDTEITLDFLGETDEFSTASLMLSLLSAGNSTEENKDKSTQDLFYENTQSIFELLVDEKEGKKSIWWDLYVGFISRLMDSENLKTYCYYITQSNGEVEQQWLGAHQTELEVFYKWLGE